MSAIRIETSIRARHLSRVLRLVAIGSLALLPTGCYLFPPRVANPVPGLKEISLIPVAAETIDRSTTWTSRLRNNLLRVDGVDRVELVAPAMAKERGRSNLLPIAETSQALIEVELLDFNPYYPPSATVKVDLYVPSGGRTSSHEGIEMDRWGSLSKSKVRVARHRVSFTVVVRTEDPESDLRLRLYAATLTDDDRGYDAVDRILRTSDRFIDFVAYESVRQSFNRLSALYQEEGSPRG